MKKFNLFMLMAVATIIPQGNKVKIDSSEKRIKNKVLSKAQ